MVTAWRAAFFQEQLRTPSGVFPLTRRAREVLGAILDRSVKAFAPDILSLGLPADRLVLAVEELDVPFAA